MSSPLARKAPKQAQFYRSALVLGLALIASACFTGQGHAADTEPEWRDPEFKNARIKSPPLKGKYYEAEIPDTLELTRHAEFSINALTRLLEPKYDYTQFSFCEFRSDPPTLAMGHGGLTNLNPKWMEALPLMRIMSGSKFNLERDGKLVGSLVHNTAPDGVTYQPIDHPGAFYDEFTRKQNKPAADMFGEGRQLLALSVWTQLSSNPIFREIAERKTRRLLEIAVKKNNSLYYKLGRGYYPGQKNLDELKVYAITDHEVSDASKIGLVGTAAAHTVATAAMGAARYYAVTKYEPALELARGMARYMVEEAKLIDEEGKWHGWHFHIISNGLLGVLEYASVVDDQAMLEWCRRAYEYGKSIGEPLLGFYAGVPALKSWDYNPSKEEVGKDRNRTFVEPCSIADMLLIGLKLTQEGMGDYYEDIEYSLRNMFVESQVTNLDFLADFPTEIKEKIDLSATAPDPRQMVTEDAAARGVGSWVCTKPEQWHIGHPGPQACSCCLGNAARVLYYTWDSILDTEGENLRVHMLLNRASRWADVESHLPYEGKVVLRMKKDRNVQVRIPSWTDADGVSCQVNGKAREAQWKGRYVSIPSVEAGDVVTVQFPMVEKTIWRQIRETDYTITFRGFTVVDLSPKADVTPIFQRAHLRRDRAPMRKVTRHISERNIQW